MGFLFISVLLSNVNQCPLPEFSLSKESNNHYHHHHHHRRRRSPGRRRRRHHHHHHHDKLICPRHTKYIRKYILQDQFSGQGDEAFKDIYLVTECCLTEEATAVMVLIFNFVCPARPIQCRLPTATQIITGFL